MDLLNKLHWRYAVKKFNETKTIQKEDIQYLLEGIRMTASSMGLQAYKVINVENKALREKLVEVSMGQDKVAKASHLFVFAIVTDTEKAINDFAQVSQNVRNLTDDDTDQIKQRLYNFINKKSEAEIKEWLTRQTYIALGNLLSLCAEKNIDACPMEGFSKTDYDKILGLEKLGLSTTVIATLGYRAEDDSYANLKKVRQPMADFVINL